MEALIYSEKSTLDNFAITLTEVPDPECGDSDLLIEVKSIGINPGEAQFRRTVDPPAGGYMILGYEFSGIVRSAGKAVSGFKPGDAVMGIGDHVVFLHEGYKYWEGNHKEIMSITDGELFDFIFASDFLKNLRRNAKVE